jgi:predicted  nucleic acid-binding Zn-ribbon protein
MSRSVARVAKEALDDAAQQIRLFLALDPRSGDLLIDEILREDDLSAKLGKFIQLAVDRLRFQADALPAADLIREISAIDPRAPAEAHKFRQWLVGQFRALTVADRDAREARARPDSDPAVAKLRALAESNRTLEAAIGQQAQVYNNQICELEAAIESLRAVKGDRLRPRRWRKLGHPRHRTREHLRLRWRQLKHSFRRQSDQIEGLRNALTELKTENCEFCQKICRLERTLESQLTACHQEKARILRKVKRLHHAKVGLTVKIEGVERGLAERDCESREWKGELAAIAGQLSVRQKRVQSPHRAHGPPAQGIPKWRHSHEKADIHRLRERLDGLQDAIDELQSTLVRPIRGAPE